METRNVRAHVQYGDFRGTAAADMRSDWTLLSKFAEAYGVDVNRYDPIGIELSMGEYHGDQFEAPVGVTLLCFDTERIGGSGYEAVTKYLESVEKPEVVLITLKADVGDWLRCFKRLSVVLLFAAGTRLTGEYVVKERIDLSE